MARVHFLRSVWQPLIVRKLVRLAACLITSLASFHAFAQASLSDGVDPTTASAVQLEQAQRQFTFAKALYVEGRHREALAAFSRSRSIVASPNARLYRARCLRELGQTVESYAEFGRTMVEALELAKQEARYARAAAAARQERKQLERHLAFLRVNVSGATENARLYVAGEEMRRGAWSEPFPTEPGGVVLLLKNGGNQAERTVELVAGEHKEVSLSFPSPDGSRQSTVAATPVAPTTASNVIARSAAAEPSGLGPWFYTTAGVAVVGLGTFAVLGAKSRSSFDEAAGMCSATACETDPAEVAASGKTQQNLANIGLVVGGLAAAAALTIVLVDGSSREEPPISVSLAVHPARIALTGAF